MQPIPPPQNIDSVTAADTAATDAGDTARWHTLLDRLSVPRLTDIFISKLLKLPDYNDAPLPLSELRRTGAASFQLLIQSLRHDVDTQELAAQRFRIAADVGVSRARAEVPVESLMTAVRQDFSVLWTELRALADNTDSDLLVRHTESVWLTVDSYAGQVQTTYVAERQRMQNEASSVRQGYIAGIFGPTTPTAERLAQISGALGVEQDEPMNVAVAAGEEVPGLRVAVTFASQHGQEIFTHPLPDGLVAFWPAVEAPGSILREAAGKIRQLRCGLVEGAGGLASLAPAARIARELADQLHDGEQGALTLKAAWARIARTRLAETGIPVAADVDTALAGCGGAERTRLVEAVQAYLATGSVADSSRRLFCHRNTVMNRLRRFGDLTGIDVLVPEQAARLVVAWS
ncbi:helix-turn-helix domain-containing protein [Arthrobacter castelli]|uniref:helix-turn-helix domain-containing protein n=1 Tax=Arthrobacter castelli TaxID=271431 RepID=UPI0003F60AF3|nr:helix-turn-helix domain-containing protein [Arthrobacter castelli]